MPVRKTESRLPAGYTAVDLGQSSSIGDVYLVSYLSSPIACQRLQTYYVFVTDAAVAATVSTYHWTVNGIPLLPATTIGFQEYTPQSTGSLSISAELKNSGAVTIATVTLQQNVVPLNVALEGLVDKQDRNIPSAAHPATSREMINDLRMYANAILPSAQDDLFNKAIMSASYAAAMTMQQVQRNNLLVSYASIINSGHHENLLAATENGIGVSKVRPQVLAMFLDKPGSPGKTYIPFAELPAERGALKIASQGIQDNFNLLTEDEKTDLFNLLRFPRANYMMAKLVFEKLKDKYFSSSTLPQILGVKASAEKLLVQYDVGPVVSTGSASSNKFAKAVFNIMQQEVWKIPVLPMANGAGVVVNAGGSTVTPFGSPEQLPELTFIARARDNDNGYIRTAFLYHDTYGLNPVEITSFEDLVTKLSKFTSHISRMRLVSHFFIDPKKKERSSMFMPFFTPGKPLKDNDNSRFTIKERFDFGLGDDPGLASFAADSIALISGHVTDKISITIEGNKEAPFLKVIVGLIRKTHAHLLQPFSLQGPLSTPAGIITTYLKYCCDLYFLNHAELIFKDPEDETNVLDLPPDAVNALTNFIESKIIETGMLLLNKGYNEDDIDALGTFIAALELNSFFGNPLRLGTYYVPANAMFIRPHFQFGQELALVKKRFDNTSFIDVRGCRIGQDPDFLTALQNFFGITGNLPKVSAPDWYQIFTFLGWSLPATEAQVDAHFNNGIAGTFRASDIQREYANWGGRLGITSHLSFWSSLATGDVLDFLAFKWIDNIPGLALPAVKLLDFKSLGFANAIIRLGEIFNVSASVPANLQAFESGIQPQVAALKTATDAVGVMNAGTPASELNNMNNALQQIQAALQQNWPPPPPTITLAYLASGIQKLATYVTSKLDIASFLNAVKAKLLAPTAGFRYLQFVGLPLLVQSENAESKLRLIMLDELKNDAVKTWIKGQWNGSAPAATSLNSLSFSWSPGALIIPNTPSKNDDDLTSLGKVLQFAALLVDHDGKEMAANPTYEYQQHIKSTN